METKLTLTPTLTALPLAAMAILVALAALKGWRLPLIGSTTGALIALLLLAKGACFIAGAGLSFSTLGPTHWTSLAGILLGVTAVLVLLSAFTGLWLPGIGSQRAALMALATVVGLKVLVGFARYAA